MATATLPRTAPGYRAPYRHSAPPRSFAGVGPQLWQCHRCHQPGTFSNPLDVVPAPDPDGPYSHLFIHRRTCP